MHQSVLLQEVIHGLELEKGDTVVDGTLGSAGHAKEVLSLIGDEGTLIGIDRDQAALDRAKEEIGKTFATVHFLLGNFRDIKSIVGRLGLKEVDAIMLDLGLNSEQLENSGRGFTFTLNEPLLMTFAEDPSRETFTARDIVNEWEEENIADIIHGYGEERFARRIAKAITRARASEPIETTHQLVAIIEGAVPTWYARRKIHPATKTFQALRIAVNDEIESLKDALSGSLDLLAPGGRIAVISFHSIEDRVVKHFFRNATYDDRGVVITKKPLTPTNQEIKNNPRSRSAKLRIFEKYDSNSTQNKDHD